MGWEVGCWDICWRLGGLLFFCNVHVQHFDRKFLVGINYSWNDLVVSLGHFVVE